jgi:hypothetical protein
LGLSAQERKPGMEYFNVELRESVSPAQAGTLFRILPKLWASHLYFELIINRLLVLM